MSVRVRFKKGDFVFRAGSACNGFLQLEQGSLKVTLHAANGGSVVLYRVVPGQICLQTFSCLIKGEDYAAEGIAETDVVGELTPRAAFQARLADDPAFRNGIFAAVAARFADFEALVQSVALTALPQRLAGVLLARADEGGRVGLTHAALAEEIASARSVVSRQLSQFARAGLIELARGKLIVRDRDGLSRIQASER
jgi:CRP/FNR family transcriptional regulator